MNPTTRLREIASPDNAFYKQLRRLAGGVRERRKQGRTLLEGEHLVAAYADRFGDPDCVILRQSHAGLFKAVRAREAIVLSDPLFDALAVTRTPAGIMALVAIPSVRVESKAFTLLLEDIRDPGNLGALIRTAAAAGVDAVYLSRGCADAWSPKVLRAAQGAHFVVPILEAASLIETAAAMPGQVLATDPQARESVFGIDLTGPTAFLFGNEGAGLSETVIAAASRCVRIPMPGRVESLNVAAAAAVCLFERVRQQQAPQAR
jgi:TrmH family RNA methyltransferase